MKLLDSRNQNSLAAVIICQCQYPVHTNTIPIVHVVIQNIKRLWHAVHLATWCALQATLLQHSLVLPKSTTAALLHQGVASPLVVAIPRPTEAGPLQRRVS